MAGSRVNIESGIIPILPLGSRVLLIPKRMPDYIKSQSGKITLIVPESCKPIAPTTGIVKALGDELVDMDNCRIKIGNEVLFSMYAGVEVKFREGNEEGSSYMILEYDDILGILQENCEFIPEEVAKGVWKEPNR